MQSESLWQGLVAIHLSCNSGRTGSWLHNTRQSPGGPGRPEPGTPGEPNTSVPVTEAIADAAKGDRYTCQQFADSGCTLVARVLKRVVWVHVPRDNQPAAPGRCPDDTFPASTPRFVMPVPFRKTWLSWGNSLSVDRNSFAHPGNASLGGAVSTAILVHSLRQVFTSRQNIPNVPHRSRIVSGGMGNRIPTTPSTQSNLSSWR